MDVKMLEKYDVPVPRYTSYPTVPLWDNANINAETWMKHVEASFNHNKEISLYIHLPYCEALCTYCGCNKHITKNHLVEVPYIRAVLREWQMYIDRFHEKPVIRSLHLGGGTPTFFSPENLGKLVRGLLRDAEVAPKHDFSFEAHPHNTTRQHLEVLANLGFNRVSIGVQDFDPEVMDVINRHQTVKEVVDVTLEARALGYESINYDLIYGLPKQTLAHIARNIEMVRVLKPDRIAFYSYAHIPEVKNAQRAYSEADLPKGMDKLNLYQRGKVGLETLGYKNIGMDHFALPGDELYQALLQKRMHRNFMGYTPYYTELCIALGASSISDSWTAFAQNEKTTKEYLRKIREEDLPPIIKTHFLTQEDRKIRKHILNLMCTYETNWYDSKEDFTSELQAGFAEFEKDGLLELLPYQIKVTETGKNFIRNICRVLDARMDRHQKQVVFSKAV